MQHYLVVLYQFCLNEGPGVQDGPVPGGPGFNHRNTLENIKNSSSSEPLGSDA